MSDKSYPSFNGQKVKIDVPNLEWLDVDPDMYRNQEVLPRQSPDDVQKAIQDQWEKSIYETRVIKRIDPNISDMNVTINNYSTMNTELLKSAKNMMMRGVRGEDLTRWIKSNWEPDTIGRAIPELKKLADETGLLGGHYIDATSWSKCAQGEGVEISNLNPTAKYVLSNESKCGDCILNQKGRCTSLKKAIVYEVPYTESDAVAHEGRKRLTGSVHDSPRERIKKALLSHESVDTPNSWHIVDRNQDLRKSPEKFGSEDFKVPVHTSLYRDVSKKMMASRGKISDTFKRRFSAVSDNDSLKALQDEEFLLGNVYVRSDVFDTCDQARTFFRNNSIKVPYILKRSEPCPMCHAQDDGFCKFDGFAMVTSVAYDRQLLSSLLRVLLLDNRITQESRDAFMRRANKERVQDLLKEAYSTQGMDIKGNYTPETFDTHISNPVEVSPVKISSEAGDVVKMAYKLAYDAVPAVDIIRKLQNRFGSSRLKRCTPYIKSAINLTGLLGHSVVDLRGFSTSKEARDFLAQKNMDPDFLLVTGCCTETCSSDTHDSSCKSHDFKNLDLLEEEDLKLMSDDYVKSVLSKRRASRKLSDRLYNTICAKMSHVTPMDALKAANTLSMAPEVVTPPQYYKQDETTEEDVREALTMVSKASKDIQENKSKEWVARVSEKVASEGIPDTFKNRWLSMVKKGQYDDVGTEMYLYSVASHAPAEAPVETSDIVLNPVMVEASAIDTTDQDSRRFRSNLLKDLNRSMDLNRIRNRVAALPRESLIREKDFIKSALSDAQKRGSVYIDPTPYSTCQSGALEVKAMKAPFVKKMGSCDKCSYRIDTNCTVYNRNLVDTVPDFKPQRLILDNKEKVSSVDPSVEFEMVDDFQVTFEPEHSFNPFDIELENEGTLL